MSNCDNHSDATGEEEVFYDAIDVVVLPTAHVRPTLADPESNEMFEPLIPIPDGCVQVAAYSILGFTVARLERTSFWLTLGTTIATRSMSYNITLERELTYRNIIQDLVLRNPQLLRHVCSQYTWYPRHLTSSSFGFHHAMDKWFDGMFAHVSTLDEFPEIIREQGLVAFRPCKSFYAYPLYDLFKPIRLSAQGRLLPWGVITHYVICALFVALPHMVQ